MIILVSKIVRWKFFIAVELCRDIEVDDDDMLIIRLIAGIDWVCNYGEFRQLMILNGHMTLRMGGDPSPEGRTNWPLVNTDKGSSKKLKIYKNDKIYKNSRW